MAYTTLRNLLTVGAIIALALAASVAAAVPRGTFNGCPRHVLPLTGSVSSYAPTARRVVLRFVQTTFAKTSQRPQNVDGARATGVTAVPTWLPSGWIKSECGKTVWERSLAVAIYLPSLDRQHNPVGRCNDCDHLMFITSRVRTGWTVWGVY